MSGYYYGDFVIPAAFVTATDVAAWMGTTEELLPTSIGATIRSCTRMVCRAIQGSFYDADPTTGLPSAAQALQAVKDATCIQASAWITLDIDPLLGGVVDGGAVYSSTKLGTATVTNADSAAAAAARAAAATNLVPEAASVLQQNDLLGTQVWTYG